ncbi:MAG: phosphate ABC transporter substrate-binding/OmpA family protein [Pseudomonadota bacterium]
MSIIRAALCAALSIFSLAGLVHAQDVTLSARDGQIEIHGTLLGFDGEFYRIDTDYGELTVDGSGVLCAGPGCPNLQNYVAQVALSGADTIGRLLLPALLQGFAQRNGYRMDFKQTDATHLLITLTERATNKKAAEFSIRLTNTDEGFADLLANEADIVLARREIRPEEHRRAAEAGMGDMSGNNRSRVLALDALVPIVAPGNPVRFIDPQDLARVFAGEIVNWQRLGGPDAPIALHMLGAESGLAQAMDDLLMAPADLFLAPQVVQHVRGQELTLAVANDPFALGLASFSDVGNGQALALRGVCGRVLRATRRTIKTEDYPLTAPMFLYLPARRLPKVAREFLNFARGPLAQITVRRAGLVDQATEEIPPAVQGDRFANAILAADAETDLAKIQVMTGYLTDMRRLSLAFRFEAGTARLDAQSRSNVQYLARALEQGRYDGRALHFVGFSDGDGSSETNQEIALERAEAVRLAVRDTAETADFDQIVMEARAYGEAMPLACDENAWGRQTNRRVEVWVR